MAQGKAMVKVEVTPQGQVLPESPVMTAPNALYTRWAWSTLLGDPRQRYGVYQSPRTLSALLKLNMLYDPVLSMCAGFIAAALVKAQRVIECRDKKKQKFFDALFRAWERDFMLHAAMAVELGSVGLVKKWKFAVPEPVEVGAPAVWSGTVKPYIITGFDPCYPLGTTPKFDNKGRDFQGITTIDGDIDVFYSLWLTIAKARVFGDYMGHGRLQSSYYDWFLKQMTSDNAIVGQQRTANPVVGVDYPPGKDDRSGKDNRTIALELGDAIQGGASMAVPSTVYVTEDVNTGEEKLSSIREWQAYFLEGGRSLTEYPDLMEHHNRMMALGQLLPPQAVMEVTGGDLGGPTSADKLTRLAEEILLMDAADIDTHLNKYVWPDIEKLNFPKGSPPVRVRTVGLSETSTEQLFDLVKTVLPQSEDVGVFDLSEALKRLKMPTKEVEESQKPKAEEKKPEESQAPNAKREGEEEGAEGKEEVAATAVDPETGKLQPDGKPLKRWGREQVPISVEDIALTVGAWDGRAPEPAQGFLEAVTMEQKGENERVLSAARRMTRRRRVGEGVLHIPVQITSPFKGITAEAPDYSDHAMLALRVSEETAQAMALDKSQFPNALPPDELHLTLVYLGEVQDLPPAEEIASAISNLTQYRAIEGKITGMATFNAGPDGVPLVALFDSQVLPKFRQALVTALQEAGIDSPSEHGFIPHITLAYLPEDTKPPNLQLDTSITFDAFYLAYGDEWMRFPFGAAEDMG